MQATDHASLFFGTYTTEPCIRVIITVCRMFSIEFKKLDMATTQKTVVASVVTSGFASAASSSFKKSEFPAWAAVARAVHPLSSRMS